MPSSFFALFDDIATLLDDIAVLSKVAAKKTAGVLGDDLALNAEQVSDIQAKRELPVVWAVAKGSLVNKAILVPTALAISAFAPWAITPLLMVGGTYLCYEGVEKLAHRFLHKPEDVQQQHDALIKAVADEQVDMVAFEKNKIKGAIRTDFILSAEIIVISLGVVAGAGFTTQLGVLSGIALIITIGVYGLVGSIVKLDDLGLRLIHTGRSAMAIRLGRGLLVFAPKFMKFLSVAGTAAMFLVGGGILVHGFGALHHWITEQTHGPLGWLWQNLFNAGFGIIAGALALAVVTGIQRLRRTPASSGAAAP